MNRDGEALLHEEKKEELRNRVKLTTLTELMKVEEKKSGRVYRRLEELQNRGYEEVLIDGDKTVETQMYLLDLVERGVDIIPLYKHVFRKGREVKLDVTSSTDDYRLVTADFLK